MKYKLAEGVTLESADGTYVFLKDNGDAAVPNHVGGDMVRALLSDGLDGCVEHVTGIYEVSDEEARIDIEGFACELEGHGLVEKVDG